MGGDAPGTAAGRPTSPPSGTLAGTDPTWAGRVRRSLDDPRALDLFPCGDNLRQGTALNTVQVAELIVAELVP